MNKSGMHLMEWTPELGQRAETKLDFVVQPSDLVFGDPSFVIRHAGVYSEPGTAYQIAPGERDSRFTPLIHYADDSQWGLVNAMTESAKDPPANDRAVELQTLGGRVLELKPNQWRAIATAPPAAGVWQTA